MLDSPPRSDSPTSPTPDAERAWQSLYFCRFPGCNKGYASTDGVRKHCRKHHADWLAELDDKMRENNQKHSAANYCSTQPAEPAKGEFATITHARKRPRTDSGSSAAGAPRLDQYGTPRIEPIMRRGDPAAELDPDASQLAPLVLPVRTPPPPTKAEIFPVFDDNLLSTPRATDEPDRPLLSALAALEERPSAWPYKGGAKLSQNFFSLSAGMPVPKRGLSLTSDAMTELARECDKGEAGNFSALADFNSFLLADEPDPSSPEHRESCAFISDVLA